MNVTQDAIDAIKETARVTVDGLTPICGNLPIFYCACWWYHYHYHLRHEVLQCLRIERMT